MSCQRADARLASATMPCMYWRRRRYHDGLVSATVGPTTVPKLTAVFDPDAPWVLVSDFGPLGEGWQTARVPSLPAQALDPVTATIRGLRFDLLLHTSEFLTLAPGWGEYGLQARQLTKRPDGAISFGTARNPPPAGLLRAVGLVVAVDLKEADGMAQILATSIDALQGAMIRLDAAG
jgi:hypothetical protein